MRSKIWAGKVYDTKRAIRMGGYTTGNLVVTSWLMKKSRLGFITIEINDDLGHAFDWIMEQGADGYINRTVNMTLNRTFDEVWQSCKAHIVEPMVISSATITEIKYLDESEEVI
jgi:hypothetical protein